MKIILSLILSTIFMVACENVSNNEQRENNVEQIEQGWKRGIHVVQEDSTYQVLYIDYDNYYSKQVRRVVLVNKRTGHMTKLN